MLPRRGPRHATGSHRHPGRADAGVRRRAGGRAAQRRGDPPPVHAASRRRTARATLAPVVRPRRRSTSRPRPPWRRWRADGFLVLRRPRRRRAADAEAGGVRRRARPRRRVARTRPRRVGAPTVALPARARRGARRRSTPAQPPAAVLIRPVSVAEIERTAREGLLMPPKSTFFTPKLRTGFVIRRCVNSPRRATRLPTTTSRPNAAAQPAHRIHDSALVTG